MDDASPFPLLRQTLAALYPAVDDSKVVLADAGLTTQRIAFATASDTNWYNILEEARRQNEVGALLDVVARGDYGKNPTFVAARQAYLDWAATQPGRGGGSGFSLRIPRPLAAPKLYGRDRFLSDLTTELPASQRIALWGIAGVGKTSLALALAKQTAVADAFPDGRAWIALGHKPNVFVELGRLMDKFGLPSEQLADADALVEALRRGLEGRRYLLVLDDLWQSADAQPFLDACQPPACAVLTTSQVQVADDLGAVSHEVRVLQTKYAVEMLAAAGSHARLAVEANRPDALCLTEDLGCLPLALEATGRRLNRLARADGPALAVSALRRELFERIRLLHLTTAERRPGLAAVEPSLEAILGVSYDALPGEDRRQAFRRLAVFGPQPLTFTAAAMVAVWGVEEDQATDLRLDLVDASLLQRVQPEAGDGDTDGASQLVDQTSADGGEARYVLHPVIAALAAVRLEQDSAEERAARLAHGQYYASGVAAVDKQIPTENELYGLAWLDREIDQVRRVIAWTQAQRPDDETAQLMRDLVVPLRRYALGARNLHREYGDWLDGCRDACRWLEDKAGEANVLRAKGDVVAFLAQREEALERYEEALRLYRTVGDRVGEANVLKAQGDVLHYLKHTDEALGRYEEALTLFRAVGEPLGEAKVLRAQGDVMAFLEQRDEAFTRYEEALRLFRAVGARLGEANVLTAQGTLALRGGQIDLGMALLEQARQIYQLIGTRAGLSKVGIRLARYAASQGDWARAIDRMQPAADFYVEIKHPHGARLQAEIDEWRSQLQG